MVKKFCAILLAVTMLFSLAACSQGTATSTQSTASTASTAATESTATTSDGGTFRLGVFEPLSGGSAAYGNEALNSIKLAAKLLNEQGGLNGQQIEVLAYDTQSSPEEAVKVVNKMITEDNVNAVIGSLTSSEVLAAGSFLNDAGIYTLGLGTAATWMQQGWDYVFRPTMNNDLGAGMIVDMFSDLGYTKVGVLTGQDDSSISTANRVKELCGTAGIEVVAFEQYEQGDTDFTGQITTILKAEPDGIFTAILGDVGGTVVKQFRQNGYNGLLFDKESFSPAKAEVAGDAATYIAFPSPYVVYNAVEACDIPIVRAFIEEWIKEYGSINKTDSAYRGWDAMLVLAEAARLAGSNDPDAMREAAHSISIEGLGGQLDYTSGTGEGYETFNKFILVDGVNILWESWLESNGYEEYLAATNKACELKLPIKRNDTRSRQSVAVWE